MNYEQKAKELVDKYKGIVNTKSFYGYDVTIENATTCAIFEVDAILEVISEVSLRINNSNILYEYNEGIDQANYWQEVRKAIEALKQ